MKMPDDPTLALNRDLVHPPASPTSTALSQFEDRPLPIRDVRVTVTAPEGMNLIVVRILTDEPGLDGLGCATFAYRHHAVRTTIEKHLRPLLLGRDASRIGEIQRLMHLNAYWRNGPVENNAISGIDMALWDIKAKRAGMPLYQLLGGKLREAAPVYRHSDGGNEEEVLASAAALIASGVRHIRLQLQGYGGSAAAVRPRVGRLEGAYFDPAAYRSETIRLLRRARTLLGDDVELLHDVHERLAPADAVAFARDLEEFRLFWLEDPLSIEHIDWLPRLRQATTTPLAMGELFNHPLEWTRAIESRSIDFLRIHLSQIGGLTPSLRLAHLADHFGVRTAWHGPGDRSPVGHAINLHLNLVAPNFGIQEFCGFGAPTLAVFPGCPALRDGHLWAHPERPGHGIELDEAEAAKFPEVDRVTTWTQARLSDGALSPP